MTTEVGLYIPEDIAEQMRQSTGQDIARHIFEAYALSAYQERTLRAFQLRRLLGFATRDEFEDFLAAHHEIEQRTGYCWRTLECRNLCVRHAFLEGKKAGETSPRKSTPRTLKEVR